MSDVLVVGSGLIGTSIGLALAGERDVCLSDASDVHLRAAVARGAGRAWDGREPAAVVVVAVPPARTAARLVELMQQRVGRTYTHVAGVQAPVQEQVLSGPGTARFVGSHPMAGRELAGPAAAAGDLFLGRRWAVCPTPSSAPDAVQAVERLAIACGAVPVRLPADEHDAAVALVSHLPHAVSALLAGMLRGDQGRTLDLAGPGLADMTRIAAGDPELWLQVLAANATRVGPLLTELARAMSVAAALLGQLAGTAPGQGEPADPVTALRGVLERGRQGRALVPVKRGLLDSGFASVRVVLRRVTAR